MGTHTAAITVYEIKAVCDSACLQPSHGSCNPNIRHLVLAASNCDLVEERLASSPALELVISATEVLRPWISVCLELSSSSKQ
jgi:hypothetical protein